MVTWNLRDTPESRARQHQAKIKGNSFDFEMISTCLLHETCWAVRPIGKGDQRLRRREKESTAPESVTHVVKGDKKVISSPLCVFVSLHHKKKRQPHEKQNPWNKLINFIDHFGLSLDTKRERSLRTRKRYDVTFCGATLAGWNMSTDAVNDSISDKFAPFKSSLVVQLNQKVVHQCQRVP